MLSFRSYVAYSALGAAAMVSWAFATREQFFPAVAYLTTARVPLAILANAALAALLCTHRLITALFLGRLRDAEVERVHDRLAAAAMETCLAMTVFRDEASVEAGALFACLAALKVLHWLAADRVAHLESAPPAGGGSARVAAARLAGLLALLLALDSAFLRYTLDRVLPARYSSYAGYGSAPSSRGGGVHLLFAFEAVVLASGGLGAAAKAGLAAIDAAAGGAWEGRGAAAFYIDLATDLLHLTGYAAFFAAVAAGHGLPLHLLRDVWWTARSLRDRARAFLAYRAAAAGLEARLADADADDLARCGGVCIVCREEMGAAGGGGSGEGGGGGGEGGGGDDGAAPPPAPRPHPAGPRAKRLPCGHAFHVRCLRSWLERQQACPICRAPVMGEAPAPPANAAAPAAAAAAPPADAPPAPPADAVAQPDADGLRRRRGAGEDGGAPFAGAAAAAAAAAAVRAAAPGAAPPPPPAAPAAPAPTTAATPAAAAAAAAAPPPLPVWPAGPLALFFPIPPGTPAPPGGWAAGLAAPGLTLPPGVGAVALAPGLSGAGGGNGGGLPAALIPPAAWAAAGATLGGGAAPPPVPPQPPATPAPDAPPQQQPPADDDADAVRRARLERLGVQV